MRKFVATLVAVSMVVGLAVNAQSQARQERRNPQHKVMQEGRPPMISPEKKAEFMAKELELNDAEKAKVQALFEKQTLKAKQHQEEMKKMMDDHRVLRESERAANEAELIKIIGLEKFQKLQSQRIARLEKENRMLKMRMMRKDAPVDRQKMRMEKRRKMHQQRQ